RLYLALAGAGEIPGLLQEPDAVAEREAEVAEELLVAQPLEAVRVPGDGVVGHPRMLDDRRFAGAGVHRLDDVLRRPLVGRARWRVRHGAVLVGRSARLPGTATTGAGRLLARVFAPVGLLLGHPGGRRLEGRRDGRGGGGGRCGL